MGAFKEMSTPDESDELIDHCDDCGKGILEGQKPWVVDGEIYCNSTCFKNAK